MTLALALAALLLAGGGERPVLRPLTTAPLTVRGAGFEVREPVVLTLTTQRARVVRRVRADARGAFTVRFPLFVAVDPCRGRIVVRAVGARGSRAVYERECRPGDPQPP